MLLLEVINVDHWFFVPLDDMDNEYVPIQESRNKKKGDGHYGVMNIDDTIILNVQFSTKNIWNQR